MEQKRTPRPSDSGTITLVSADQELNDAAIAERLSVNDPNIIPDHQRSIRSKANRPLLYSRGPPGMIIRRAPESTRKRATSPPRAARAASLAREGKVRHPPGQPHPPPSWPLP